MSIFMPKTIKSFQIGTSLFYQVVDFVNVDTQAIVTPPTVLRKCSGGTINPQESEAHLIKVGPQKFLNNSSATGLEEKFNDRILVVASVFVMFPDNTGQEIFFRTLF